MGQFWAWNHQKTLGLTPKVSCVFFTKLSSFWKNQIILKLSLLEFKEVTIGSWSYVVENQPPKITAPFRVGSLVAAFGCGFC